MHTIKFIQYTVSVKSSFQSSTYIIVSDSEFNSRFYVAMNTTISKHSTFRMSNLEEKLVELVSILSSTPSPVSVLRHHSDHGIPHF